jgi:hypothetical protein
MLREPQNEDDFEHSSYAAYFIYARVFPGRKSGFRAGLWPESGRESLKIGPPAGRMPADFEVVPMRIRPKSGTDARFPARKQYCVTYLQSFRHFKLFFFGLDQDMATTWTYIWSPELISGALFTFFEPGPLERVPGPSLAGKWPETDQTLNCNSCFLV